MAWRFFFKGSGDRVFRGVRYYSDDAIRWDEEKYHQSGKETFDV